MSDLAPDYKFYKDEYHGTAGEDEFNALIGDAEGYVKYLIGWNPVDTEERKLAYKRACCASAQVFSDYGEGTGFTIGSFTLRGDENPQLYWQVTRKVYGELLASGLLWGGVS